MDNKRFSEFTPSSQERMVFWGIELRPLLELDCLRFIAISLVVLHHQAMDFDPFMAWMKDFGWSGVDIFFTMSGFLITQILQKEFDRKNTIELKKFWIRRAIRLWPSWLLVLMVSTAVLFIFARNNIALKERIYETLWLYYLHLANYATSLFSCTQTIVCHYWSLALEEHFYILWPPLLIAYLKKPKLRIWIILFLLLVPYLFRVFHALEGHERYWSRQTTHARIDAIAWGCFLALYFDRLPRLKIWAEAFALAVSVFLLYLAFYVMFPATHNPWLQYANFTMISWATCLWLWISLKGEISGVRRFLRSRLLAWCGIMSYGVYLVHLLSNAIVFSLLKRFSLDLPNYSIVAINFILPYAGAAALYYYVDKPVEKIKKRFY